ICERDPDKAAERDRRMLEEITKNPAPTIRQSLIPGLVSGFIARRDGDKTPGALFPQPVVADALGREGMLDDFGSPGFRLVYRADVDPAPLLAELDKAAPALPVALVPLLESGSVPNASTPGYRDKDGLLERWMERHECRIVLVRPDHYVYGSASTPDQGVELIRELRRALKPM
ncbi:MAG: 2-polyprenyl-6-methoxyphenol hydroxylase, partial [Noviherbaspirillum sp.]